MKSALSTTINYLNNLEPTRILGLFINCLFLGWNGIQIFFSLGLLLTFVDSKSMTNLMFNSLKHQSESIPIYIFSFATIILVHWLFHCFAEVSFSAKLQMRTYKKSELKNIALNFFVPNLLIVLAIILILTTAFLFIIFLRIAASGFEPQDYTVNLQQSFLRLISISVISSVIISMLLTDNVLPKMLKYHSFKSSLYLSIIHIRKHFNHFLIFYVFKTLLIIVSIIVFQSLLRHFFLPYFLMLEDKYSFTFLMSSSKLFNFSHIISNVFMLTLILISSLIVFSPIMAPLYIYQRMILFKWTKY